MDNTYLNLLTKVKQQKMYFLGHRSDDIFNQFLAEGNRTNNSRRLCRFCCFDTDIIYHQYYIVTILTVRPTIDICGLQSIHIGTHIWSRWGMISNAHLTSSCLGLVCLGYVLSLFRPVQVWSDQDMSCLCFVLSRFGLTRICHVFVSSCLGLV